jgi:hypothetical protein
MDLHMNLVRGHDYGEHLAEWHTHVYDMLQNVSTREFP